jgi:hypothetical protein
MIAEEEPVSAIVLDSPSIRFALVDAFPHGSVKVCANCQVLARQDTAEDVVGHEPVRNAAFVRGSVP